VDKKIDFLEARMPPGCTESHCPTVHAVPAGEPATPVIQTINARVPPGCGKVASLGGLSLGPAAAPVIRSINTRVPSDDVPAINMMPGLEQVVLWEFPIELLARIIHHQLARAQGTPADQHVKTSLSLKQRGMDIDFEAEGDTWKIQVSTMPHGDEGGGNAEWT